jgi:hypothetical protein
VLEVARSIVDDPGAPRGEVARACALLAGQEMPAVKGRSMAIPAAATGYA